MRDMERLSKPCVSSCLGRTACRMDMGRVESDKQVTPHLTSSELCFESIREYYRGRGKTAVKEKVRASRYSLEAAMSHDDEEESRGFFDHAEELIDEIIQGELPKNNKGTPFYYTEALILRAQLPMYREQRLAGELSQKIIHQVQHEIVDLLVQRPLRANDPSKLRMPLNSGRVTELAIGALLLGSEEKDMAPFWGLPREECHQDLASQNHDIYILRNGKKDPAIQIKSINDSEHEKRYEDNIMILTLEDVISSVDDESMNLDILINLLEFEDKGCLRASEKDMLETMRNYCVNQVNEHRQKFPRQ